MSRYLSMAMPPFVSDLPRKDNWRTVAKVRSEARAAAQVLHPGSQAVEEEHHIF